jgi:hypothetical protein
MSESNTITHQPYLPEAVRRASARADELAREAGVANVPEGDTPVVNGEGGEEPVQQQLDLGDQPRPQPQPQPVNDWEQRYNTLQGKYNSEVPELRGQLHSLQTMVAQMNQPRRAEDTFESTPRTRPLPPPTREVPQEDIEAYGQDLIEASQRWADAKYAPILQDYERRLLAVEGNNQQLATYTTQQRVDMALTQAMPDWERINVDPNFVAWLNQPDMFSGQTRKTLIDNAYNSGDAARTIAFFRAYKNEQTVVGQQPGTQTFQTDQAERLPLADLAVPGRGRSVSSPAPGAPEARIWTTADVNAFYRQKQRGYWAGREAEAERLERDIILAPLEGRFRQS